ncbi:MAG: methylenetetrahydrofolate reductase [bacterium]
MKVIEHLDRATEPLISFEIVPLQRGGKLKNLLRVLDDLTEFKPRFIDVTSHASDAFYEETPSGIERKVKRKRPGTLGICALIQKKYEIDAVPHVLCANFTREETEDFLIELQYLEIENVLALRGDLPSYEKPVQDGRSVNRFAVDLVEQLSNMNRGKYLEELLDAEPSDFCIGVAGYPEKHYEAPNLLTDIRHLKAKVDAGAEYIVTQMFFENSAYFDFAEKCRAEGIEVPIIPGLKVVSSKQQLTTIPQTFHVDIPFDLSEEIRRGGADSALDTGVEWTASQARELLDRGVPAIHFYVIGQSKPIRAVMKKLGRC